VSDAALEAQQAAEQSKLANGKIGKIERQSKTR
jgi:hypothetical protein